MSERTVEAGSHCTLNRCADQRWTESDALDPTFEKRRKAQVMRIRAEAVSLHFTSMAPSLDGPASGRSQTFATGCDRPVAVQRFCAKLTFSGVEAAVHFRRASACVLSRAAESTTTDPTTLSLARLMCLDFGDGGGIDPGGGMERTPPRPRRTRRRKRIVATITTTRSRIAAVRCMPPDSFKETFDAVLRPELPVGTAEVLREFDPRAANSHEPHLPLDRGRVSARY